MDALYQTILIPWLVGAIAYFAFPQLAPAITRLLGTNAIIARLRQRWNEKRFDRVCYAFFAVAALFFLARAWHDYASFNSWHEYYWNIDRVVLALLRGESLIPYLADRYNPIVIIFVPLFAISQDPRMVLTVQSLGLAIAVFPIYWFARRHLGRALGFIVSSSFLFSVHLSNLNNGNFFELKLALPSVTFAAFFLLSKRYVPFLVAFGMALLVKEDVAVVSLGIAAFLFFNQRQHTLGLIIGALCVGLAFIVTEVLYPAFHNGQSFYIWAERYSYLGNTLSQIIQTMISHPGTALAHITTNDRIAYVVYLLKPLAGLALLGLPVTAIMSPALLFGLLSEWPQQSDPTQYYQTPLLPFVFFGAVLGIERVLRWRTLNASTRAKFALALGLIASAQLYSADPWARVFSLSYFSLTPHDAIGHQLINQMEPGTYIAAQLEFITWIRGTRQHSVGTFATGRDSSQIDYVFGDVTRPWYGRSQEAAGRWFASGYFETLAEQDGYFLLKRKTSIDPAREIDNGWALLGYAPAPNSFNRPLNLHFANGTSLLGYAMFPGNKIKSGNTLRVIAEWRAERNIDSSLVVLAHLQDTRGYVWAQDDRRPIIPSQKWQAGDIIRDQYTFNLTKIMPPGTYRVSIGVWDTTTNTTLAITDTQGQSLGIESTIATITVEKDTIPFPADYLQIDLPKRAELGNIRLLGSTAIPDNAKPGDEIQVGLYWQAYLKSAEDYDIILRLNDANGRAVWKETSLPAGGAYSVSQWQPGEITLDWHTVLVPGNLPNGSYLLSVSARPTNSTNELAPVPLAKIQIGK